MKYRHDSVYDRAAANESRADLAEAALRVATDRNGEAHDSDVYLDVSDLVGNLVHFCARAGIDWTDACAHGEHGAIGDLEDGPTAARDPERFPTNGG